MATIADGQHPQPSEELRQQYRLIENKDHFRVSSHSGPISTAATDSEDILKDALEFLGGKPVVDDDFIHYGPIVLSLAPKQGKANTLLADHLFSPALFLAERIERGLVEAKGQRVIELGAGCALPSLLLSTQPNSPALVVVTDYPDQGILDNLQRNVKRNRVLFNDGCRVECRGYEWGTDASELLDLAAGCGGTTGYDIVILSDLLHFSNSHDDLILSLKMLLSKNRATRAYVGAGKYTHVEVCNSFLEKAKNANMFFEEVEGDDGSWMGAYQVSNLTSEDLQLRKANCRYWMGSWLN